MKSKNSGEHARGVRNHTRLCLGLLCPPSFRLKGTTPKKGPRGATSPGPRSAHLREREELCAIHEANVTTALLFQSQTNEKRAAHACTRAALGTNRRSYGGGGKRGYADYS